MLDCFMFVCDDPVQDSKSLSWNGFYIYFMSFISLISSRSGSYIMYNEDLNTAVISNHFK